MIYVSAVYANAERTMVIGTDAEGNTQTRPVDNPHELRREDEFITGFLASGGVIADYVPPELIPAPVSLHQVAGARLSVDQVNWEVTGVERSTGIAGAFLIDIDTVWLIFTEELPDDDFIVVPDIGVTKYQGFIEVRREGLGNINLIVQRVQ